jgi:hypothetical protein
MCYLKVWWPKLHVYLIIIIFRRHPVWSVDVRVHPPHVHRCRHLAGVGRLLRHPDRGPILLHVSRLCPAVLGHGRRKAYLAEGSAISLVRRMGL